MVNITKEKHKELLKFKKLLETKIKNEDILKKNRKNAIRGILDLTKYTMMQLISIVLSCFASLNLMIYLFKLDKVAFKNNSVECFFGIFVFNIVMYVILLVFLDKCIEEKEKAL